jgi:hypothetical protein
VTTSTLRALAWQDDAACRGMPLDAFFPLSGQVPEAAQRACSRCPVRVRCAEYGMQQTHGVWGGTQRSRSAADVAQTAKPPVPEALQASLSRTYSSRGTANTTTTTPRKAPDMTAKTTAPKPAKTTAPAAAPAPAPTAAPESAAAADTRAKSTVAKDGTHACAVCQQTLPITKFPTARTGEGTYERDTAECRSCRDARRAAKKAAKATAAA